AGLEIALAGELRAEDLPAVRASGADTAAVRSAACRGGRRTAALDPMRIAQLRTVCSVETNVNCAR
ncbi:MAG: (5-formylfuran-3-yl)methyl phosphate synthase, partial [Solirubrobacteraceae bacterium]